MSTLNAIGFEALMAKLGTSQEAFDTGQRIAMSLIVLESTLSTSDKKLNAEWTIPGDQAGRERQVSP